MAKRKPLKRCYRKLRRSLRRFLCGRHLHGLILLVCLLVVIVPFLVPLDHLAQEQVGFRWRLFCYLDDHWGVHCPSGALIRSFSHCTRGDWLHATRYYPLGPILFLYLVLQIPYRTWALIKAPRPLPRKPRRINAVYTVVIVGLIVADWLFLWGGRVV